MLYYINIMYIITYYPAVVLDAFDGSVRHA